MALRIVCDNCKTAYRLGERQVGKRLRCKQCGAALDTGAAGAKAVAGGKSGTAGRGQDKGRARGKRKREDARPSPEPGDKRNEALVAWKELENARRDSYWLAVAKAVLYPFQTFGALVFFVLGTPAALTVVEIVCKWALAVAGASESMAQPDKLEYFATGVVAFGLLLVLGVSSFFCSFIYSVIRTSSEGRISTPVIQGMHHRANLAGLCAWAAVYFGPGLFLAFHLGAGDGDGVDWTIPGLVLLAGACLMAPMGLLCSATVNAVAGLNFLRVAKGIVRLPREYFYLVLVVAIGAAVFIAAGMELGSVASREYDGNRLLGLALRFLSSLCYMFPPVILARALGLFMQYHRHRLPFAFDVHSEHKGSMIPQAVALVGVLALFPPCLLAAKAYAHKGGKATLARRHLRHIYEQYLLDGSRRKRTVRDTAALEKLVPAGDLVCPARPGVEHIYQVVPNEGYRTETKSFIWIYESVPTDPDGKHLNAMLHTGAVRNVRRSNLEDLLELMRRYRREKDPLVRDRILTEYRRKLIF